MNIKRKIVGATLLGLALGSEALTLGRIRGAVLIGRPLDVAVQVQTDAGEDASSQCFEADVFHADTRQDASRVRVQVQASAQAQTANVRILSSALVDEPVVTVYLRSGCKQKTTRRYVLLADLPSEVAASMPAVLGAPSAAFSAPSAPPTAPVAAAKSPVHVANPTNRPTPTNTLASSKNVIASVTRKATPSSVRPRLKLDLLELVAEREPTLNFSTELLSKPTDDVKRRSEAAALWLAVNASPEDILHQSARVHALEADVNSLKTLTAKNQLGLTDLGARLRKAESERFPASVVYALIAGLLVSLATVAFLWSRRRRVPANDNDWWNGATTRQPPATEPGSAPEINAVHQAPNQSPGLKKTSTPPAAGSWKDSAIASDMDVSMIEVSHSIFDELMQADATHLTTPLKPATSASMMAAPEGSAQQARGFNASTLLLKQQVELLAAQGRPEQAVGLLKQHLHDSGKPNPALYLELLSQLHLLGLKNDFQHYREEFGLLFNARAPEFAIFKNEGRSLEAYPQVLSRITQLWLTPQLFEFMDACIFKDPFGDKPKPFDLAALREMLLLYAVAQSIVLAPPLVNDDSAHLAGTGLPFLDRLDLDLSESDIGPIALEPGAITDVDIPLSLPDEPAQDAHQTQPPEHENMLNFYPPEEHKLHRPRGN